MEPSTRGRRLLLQRHLGCERKEIYVVNPWFVLKIAPRGRLNLSLFHGSHRRKLPTLTANWKSALTSFQTKPAEHRHLSQPGIMESEGAQILPRLSPLFTLVQMRLLNGFTGGSWEETRASSAPRLKPSTFSRRNPKVRAREPPVGPGSDLHRCLKIPLNSREIH